MEAMHRKVKGLLSLILTFAMVTVTTAPASAEELSKEGQSAEVQPIVEMVETEPEPVQEQNAAEEAPVQEPVMADQAAAEAQTAPAEEEQPDAAGNEAAEVQTAPAEEEQPDAAGNEATAPAEIEAETTSAEEQPVSAENDAAAPAEIESETISAEEQSVAETAPVEQTADGVNPVSVSDLDYLYNSLTQDQKQFRVYAGTDMSAEMVFMDNGVVPDSENLPAQGGSIIKTLLESRQGDLKFYRLSTWRIYQVDSNGAPVSVTAEGSIERIATEENFKQSAYLANNGIGTNPTVLCQKPILEPVWSCLDYQIPIYDKDGNDTGTVITINAENYGDGLQAAFPNIEADAWKLIYNGTEYRLNTAGEIWTNEINGIRAVGRDFNASQAKLQAVVLQEGTAEFMQPDWFEGQPKPAPVVSSATNGVENITYYYKEAGADDSTYTMVEPGRIGAYTAKAVFAATELYKEVVKTADFEILPNVIVDETAPVIGGVANGQTYYGEQAVTVTDEKLSTVSVNGEAVQVTDNRADITLKPAEDVYKIIAVDEAGNRTEYTIEVLETWVRDGITTDGKKNLRRERLYKLGSGQWTVDGDGTVYSGGGTFYVKNSGEYNFKRK